MFNIYRIFKKETAGYFASPSTYVFLVIFLVLAPGLFLFLSNFFGEKAASMGAFFFFLPWLFLFFVPAIAMRVWAEEKRSGTEELLMTMPVRDWEAVLGKYFAAGFLLLLALALTFPVPLMVAHFSAPKPPLDHGPILCGYLAAVLMGGAILAIGTWASSLTVNQITAFVVTFAVAGVLLLCGASGVYERLGEFGRYLSEISLFTHYNSMYRGVLDPKDIVYYLSVTAFFLFLNVRSVESRKWR